MSTREHQEIQSLLGAYSLNAVSASEARRVATHVETCAECAREARLLSEVAAELSWLPGPEESTELVDSIIAALPPRPRRIWMRAAVAAAAVSVAVAGVLGGALVRERGRNEDVSAILATARTTVRLGPQGGFEGSGTLHVADKGAVVVFEGMPQPGKDRAYQLWAISGDRPASMGVIDGHGRVVQALDWRGTADTYAVTIEAAGGSPVPTSDPVLAGS